MSKKKLKIMVSSTVYGVEELLDRMFSLLTTFGYQTEYGYEVLMSHKGTVPVSSNETAFESCLKAVEKCDLFLGIITPQYGSGVDDTGFSITHQEIKKAIELNKPRWFLAHDHVVFARRMLIDLGYKNSEDRKKLALKKGASSISNLKVIDLYEDATMEHLPLDERQGNWVQKFQSDLDASVFLTAQFSRYQDVEELLKQHFENAELVVKKFGEHHE
jgi:nucleoside 2-deoxyribosyltransferase